METAVTENVRTSVGQGVAGGAVEHRAQAHLVDQVAEAVHVEAEGRAGGGLVVNNIS